MIKSKHPQSTPPSSEVERHLTDLLQKLSLAEKIKLLATSYLKQHGMPKIGLPPIQLADGPVGVTRGAGVGSQRSGSTAFPALIALAASWNEDLAYRYGEGVGRDARARGIHFMLGPGVNIYRSPLCSRNFEYCGEDPFLAGKTAAAWVRGCQDQGVGVTVKHYALNFQEYDRYFVSSDVTERTLHEIYLPAFRMAVQEGGASGIMTAYNRVNGEYCSQHRQLIHDILKTDWGFDGFVISDAVSTHDAVKAARAGLDLELPEAEVFNEKNLLPALLDKRLTEEEIDDKVRRILRVAYCLGWMQRDQKDESIPDNGEGRAQVAYEVAAQSIVLLRNEDRFLPFRRDRVKRIAVVGPTADPAFTGGGGSSYVLPWRTVSLLQGIQQAADGEGIAIDYAKGCDPFRHHTVWQESRFFTPDGEAGVAGEYFNNKDLQGEPAVTRRETNLHLIWMRQPPAEGICKDNFSARWRGVIRPEKDGDHVFTIWGGDGEYRVKVGDEMVFDTWGRGHAGSIQNTLSLSSGREYDLLVEYRPTWRYNWIRFGWEHIDNMWPDREKALQLAREADAVVFCGGHTRFTESENFDRDFAMPPLARRFLDEILGANPNTAVVLTGGGNIEMASWRERAKAILHAWYPGQEGGRALGEILLGQRSPSGKLPITLEARLEDRSSFGSYHDVDGDKRVFLNDGIFSGYRFTDAYGPEPLYPFGFGLSYSHFEYSDLQLSSQRMKTGDALAISFVVRNAGSVPAMETAQLYLSDTQASLPRPPKELKGFAKASLEPGEAKRVEIAIDEQDLMFYDPVAHRWRAEPGEFTVLIGASSQDIRLRATFSYEG